MYRKLNEFSELYDPSSIELDNAVLLPLEGLCKTMFKLEEKMLQHWNNTQPFTILQPYIVALRKAKWLPYHRWQWWSCFWCAASHLLKEKEIDLENLLTGLNFNTPEYVSWLVTRLKQEAGSQPSVSAKLDYLSCKIINYKLLPGRAAAFIPASAKIKHVLIAALKRECKLLQLMPAANISARAHTEISKLNTGLSVPQLALFIRLMIDAKIINETNQSALLKNIAAVICTSRTASVSSESLRINYYTPNGTAKNIVKDHLLNMISLLRSY
ncbi:MAG TPA: hypothetical protein VFW07_19330 [Parafilimonas sp.]|nr:hypothetical protein [Parafilimonas sp.]